MSNEPDPAEVAASEKEAADKKAAADKAAADKLETVDLTEKPTPAEDLISKSNAASARQEEANKETARLIEEQKALKVEQTLGGHAAAGQPSQTEEEKAVEDAKSLIKGTGMEDMAFPPPETKK